MHIGRFLVLFLAPGAWGGSGRPFACEDRRCWAGSTRIRGVIHVAAVWKVLKSSILISTPRSWSIGPPPRLRTSTITWGPSMISGRSGRTGSARFLGFRCVKAGVNKCIVDCLQRAGTHIFTRSDLLRTIPLSQATVAKFLPRGGGGNLRKLNNGKLP